MAHIRRQQRHPRGDVTAVAIPAKQRPDRKAMVDASGAKIREKVTVPVLDHKRKYEIRSVKKDQKLGTWVVPNDGVIIARTK